MAVLFSNNASTTLAATVTAVQTSLTLAAGTGSRFPTITGSDFFYATLVDVSNNLEIVKVTARSADVLTVVRGQEGTTARSYVSTSKVELRVTAAGLDNKFDKDTGGTVGGPVTASGIVTGTGATGALRAQATGAQTTVTLSRTDAGTDLKVWDVINNATGLSIRAVNDANSANQPAATFTRGAGAVVDSISLFTGNTARLSINNGGDVTIASRLLLPDAGLRFGTDTALDTGINRPAENEISVVCGGTTRALFNSAGLATTGTITATGAVSSGGIELGYRNLPRVTGGLERGKAFATAAGVTINTAASGDLYTVYNDSAAAITLTQGAGVILRLCGTTTTGNLTVAPRGFANIWFNSTSEAIASGNVT